jgi:hypothetical protein
MTFKQYYHSKLSESYEEDSFDVDLGEGYAYSYYVDQEDDRTSKYLILRTPDGRDHMISPKVKASVHEIVDFHKETGRLPTERDFPDKHIKQKADMSAYKI